MTMGLEPMNPADWMEIDSIYDEEMQMRRDILKEKRHLVVAQKPGVSQRSFGAQHPSLKIACKFSLSARQLTMQQAMPCMNALCGPA